MRNHPCNNLRFAALRLRAFTLVEVLVVLIILGIASAMVVPNLGTRDDLKVAAAARMVIADVTYAQNQAILNQAMRYVNVDSTNQKYSLLISAPNAGTLVYQQNPVTLQNYVSLFGSASGSGLMATTTLLAPTIDGQTCLAFDPLGQPYSCNASTGATALLAATASIPVRCGSFTLTVKIEPYTGAMSVQ